MIINKLNIKPVKVLAIATLALFGLSACSDNDSLPQAPKAGDAGTQTFTVAVTNLTGGQPFSPLNLVLHKKDYRVWTQGQPASVPLEKLAEGGDGSDFHTLDGVTQVFTAAKPLAPGTSEVYTMTVKEALVGPLAVVTMLVNTNDGFTGVQNIDLSKLKKGESKSYRTFAYDAGTEENTEASGTMPGPADNGVGFVAERTGDVNFVYVHKGVISSADGLTTSVLSYSEIFDNPVVAIKVTRTN